MWANHDGTRDGRSLVAVVVNNVVVPGVFRCSYRPEVPQTLIARPSGVGRLLQNRYAAMSDD